MNKSTNRQSEAQPIRKSEISQVVIKLKTRTTSYYLLQKHKKWGDWSLIGGHVEDHEQGDWAAAGYREIEEELQPLKRTKDFFLLPILGQPVSWGPVQSRSAGGFATLYMAQFFAMTIYEDPIGVLNKLNPEGLCLFSESDVIDMCQGGQISNTVKVLQESLFKGLSGVPSVCNRLINLSYLSISAYKK